MAQNSMWAAIPGVDLTKANPARVYDYALGGDHNFAVDREVGDKLREIEPWGPFVAQANRAFLQRAVRHCADQGVAQFLDLGSGIPTVGNVHDVAQQRDPQARVVYVDNEAVAVAHTRHLLLDIPNAEIVHADIRDVETVLNAPATRQLLDFSKPVGLLMVAVLHYIADELHEMVQQYCDALAPGSYFVVSHATAQGREPEAAQVKQLFDEKMSDPVIFRDHSAVEALLTGFDVLDPGVVWTPSWRPDPADPAEWPPERSGFWAGVGLKR
jgi:SAM-dependent methyltransferase